MIPESLLLCSHINGKLKVTIKTVYDDTKFIKKHVGDVYMMLEKMENIYIIEL